MSRKRRSTVITLPRPVPIAPDLPLLLWSCPACRLSLHTKEVTPCCPKCGAMLTPPPEAPLTFRGMDRCDGCGAPLAPGYRLAGMCEACLATIPETAHSPSDDFAP